MIFLFLRPIREPNLDTLLLDTLEEAIRRDGAISLGTLPFNVDVTPLDPPEDCYVFEHHLIFGGGEGQLKNENVYIEDKSKNNLKFKIDSVAQRMEIPISADTFYFIHFTFDDSFNTPAEPDCNRPRVLDETLGEITFSTPRSETFFSANKLNLEITDDNYKGLKKKWFLPERNDFSITIKGTVTDIEMVKKQPPPRKDVFARDISINILNQIENPPGVFGEIVIERAVLSLKVW